MVRVYFNPDLINLSNISLPLHSGGYYFTGISRQRGAGVGDILRSLWRFVLPAVKVIGKEGLATTAKTLTDISQGESPKRALKNNSIASTKRLLTAATNSVDQLGNGASCNKNRIRGRLVKVKLPKKTRKSDIFDY